MKLKDLFKVLASNEYLRISSNELALQFEGTVSDYTGSLDRPVSVLYASVTWSGTVCIEIVLDYEEKEKND